MERLLKFAAPFAAVAFAVLAYIEKGKRYCRAAERGDAQAKYRLGVRYYHGEGVFHDEAEAVRWYRKAAERRYEPAKEALDALQK